MSIGSYEEDGVLFFYLGGIVASREISIDSWYFVWPIHFLEYGGFDSKRGFKWR